MAIAALVVVLVAVATFTDLKWRKIFNWLTYPGMLAGLPPLAAIPLAGIIAAAVAVPVAGLVFRLRGHYFAIGTWIAGTPGAPAGTPLKEPDEIARRYWDLHTRREPAELHISA